MQSAVKSRKAPARFWIGLGLVAVFWALNWGLSGLRTAYLFFPLWLGYILVVDAMVFLRSGTSLWVRSRREFALLFLVSAPAWWLFEAINHRTQNWEYQGREYFTALEYFVLASISFSTVMPAVFGTAELAATFGWVRRYRAGWRLPDTVRWKAGLWLAGIVMLTLVVQWPKHCYPFVWTSVFLILDPINAWLGRRNLLGTLQSGDWRLLVGLSLGALICGFFWEMWNFYSYPRWIYHTPGVQFLHVFEMPVLGYGGYLPFAWELYALSNLVLPGAAKVHVDGERGEEISDANPQAA